MRPPCAGLHRRRRNCSPHCSAAIAAAPPTSTSTAAHLRRPRFSPRTLLALAIAVLLFVPSLIVADGRTPPSQKFKLTIGYLTAIRGDLHDRQGLAISGALTYALDEIKKDKNLLPDVDLVLRWNDTLGDTVTATRALTDMLCDGVVAFFGPEGSCNVEAIVAQSRNKPMFSYKCSDHEPSKLPTFARTEPPNTQVTKSVIALLDYYKWKKFSILYEKSMKMVAESLIDLAKLKNMSINHYIEWIDYHTCCVNNDTCCQYGYPHTMVNETRNTTRIYVFLGSSMSLVDIMNAMQAAKMFDNGEYMVIHVDMMMYTERDSVKYLWKPDDVNKYNSCISYQQKFVEKAKSLLVIAASPPTQNYNDNFAETVGKFNLREPFYFSFPKLFNKNNYTKYVSIHAAYLYDAVLLYAKALDRLLRERTANGTKLTQEIVEEVANNGTHIVKTIIENVTYTSITGATIKLDHNGDSEGNFSMLSLQPYNYTQKNFSCGYLLQPVALFQYKGASSQSGGNAPNDELPLLKVMKQVHWPNDALPVCEPSCGFLNELCSKSDTHRESVIVAATLALLLFCAGVITMSIYRKWKIEQEIEGLLWKIDSSEIHGYLGTDMVSSPSKLSLASAASYESRCGGQVFAATGHYRGVVVRIKELKFSKKKDVARDVMKEMRLLRDIRHDNINSFIGACIEPMRILLVTDYCAKGSLYDIIENEDIKLDNMFIASLVHDLIKGMVYIHNSTLVCHGNLKSSNCVVTSRWMLQVTDFGLHEIRHCAENESIGEHQYYRNFFWKAPELLRNNNASVRSSQKGDVYAFAIILYEIIGRKGPFGNTCHEPKEIIEKVKRILKEGEEPFRPDLNTLLESETGCADYVQSVIRDCWAENPELRPDFPTIRTRLKKMKEGKNRNIMDQMMDMMVKYANNLEDLVNERTRLLIEEKQKTEDLLHRMLPEPVAKRLTTGHGVEPESFDHVTIYFSDIVGFTAMSAESTPLQVVNFLNDLYTVFDKVIKGYDVYKVETIGDAYMVVSGLPIRNGDKHAGEIASMALDLLDAVQNYTISHRPNETLKLRIGIHTGPVVAGVVGLTMPRYCLFGDTVNTASRMESNGEPLRIHISQQCKDALDKVGGYIIENRGLVNMKGKGDVVTYWLIGTNDSAVQRRDVDIGNLPPLFCRPHRSPKLNMESRQASVCGGMGIGNVSMIRRRSSVPRGGSADVDSTSTLHNSSPIQMRKLHGRQFERYCSSDATASKTTLDAFSSDADVDATGGDARLPVRRIIGRNRRVLSSIASSTDERVPYSKLQSGSTLLRESRSLDLLVGGGARPRRVGSRVCAHKRSSRSLEGFAGNGLSTIVAEAPEPTTDVHLNGNVVAACEHEDVDVPLLTPPELYNDIAIVPRSDRHEDAPTRVGKRWRSSEDVPRLDERAKKLAPNSLKSWFVGLFNGNGLRASDVSLRKGVLAGYNDMQPEKESIV